MQLLADRRKKHCYRGGILMSHLRAVGQRPARNLLPFFFSEQTIDLILINLLLLLLLSLWNRPIFLLFIQLINNKTKSKK